MSMKKMRSKYYKINNIADITTGLNEPRYSAITIKNTFNCMKITNPVITQNIENVIPVSNTQTVHINPSSLMSRTVFINKDKLHLSSLKKEKCFIQSERREKIHYNPIFFKTPHVAPSVSTTRGPSGSNIHLNPTFVGKLTSDEVTYRNENLSKKGSVNVINKEKKECVHINPKFFTLAEHTSQESVYTPALEPTCSTALSDQKGSENPNLVKQTNSIKPFTVTNGKFKKMTQLAMQNPFKKTNSKYRLDRTEKVLNDTNILNSFNSDKSKRYRCNSFQKIGKRKLVRKSILQSYISSRRHSTSYSVQHMRHIVASKARTHLPSSWDTSSKYKKINTPTLHNSQDFIKLGKRKIVRKSVLSSVHKNKAFSVISKRHPDYKVNKNVSKYKLIKNLKRNSILKEKCKRDNSKRKNYKYKWISGSSRRPASMSRSVAYRMRQHLRLRTKFQERRKRNQMKKINLKQKCIFYNRFGYCRGQDKGTCKKLHDPASVAVCHKFILGECNKSDCKLRHTKVAENMPTCHQFLQGVCIRQDCPFLHVKLSDSRPVCTHFLNGFCHNGDNCTKRHEYICRVGQKKARGAGVAVLSKEPTLEPKKKTECPLVEDRSREMKRYFGPASSASLSVHHDIAPLQTISKHSVYKNDTLLSFIPFTSSSSSGDSSIDKMNYLDKSSG